jgi:hypothetical protein
LLTGLFYTLSSSGGAMLAIETASPEKPAKGREKIRLFLGFIWHFVHFLSSSRFPNINFYRLLVMRQFNSLLDNFKPPGR